jgi:CDP-diacylglycerol--serine O-phosphatidyltransferase
MYYNHLANIFSLVNLILGFISVIFSFKSQFFMASWAIVLSVFFDGLDGQLARMNSRPNQFGRELDSLADLVSFGIAPLVLGYALIYGRFHPWAVGVLSVYLICAVLRLARYNLTPKEELSNCFIGLPVTMSGGILVFFILLYLQSVQYFPKYGFLFLLLGLSFLMISKIKYPNLNSVRMILCRSIPAIFASFAGLLLVLFASYWIAGGLSFPLIMAILFIIYLIFSPFVVKLLGL